MYNFCIQNDICWCLKCLTILGKWIFVYQSLLFPLLLTAPTPSLSTHISITENWPVLLRVLQLFCNISRSIFYFYLICCHPFILWEKCRLCVLCKITDTWLTAVSTSMCTSVIQFYLFYTYWPKPSWESYASPMSHSHLFCLSWFLAFHSVIWFNISI